LNLEHLNLGFVSDFDIRISNLFKIMFKIFYQKEQRERGAIAIILTLLIMGITLFIAFGLSAIFVNEIKNSSLVSRTAPAFYAADAGAEYGLYRITKGVAGVTNPPIIYGASVNVSWSGTISSGYINSSGTYSQTKRRVELSWGP